MAEPTEDTPPPTEEPQEDTPPPTEEAVPPKAKPPRSEAQKAALERAREKAIKVRAENAELKRMEAQKAALERAREKAERVARVEEEIASLASEDAKPRKRKPARRVIVTEASSASESDDEVEVVLPKAKKSTEDLSYQRAMSKMFTFG